MSTPIDAVVARMTLEEKVGQVMAFGFDGIALTPDLEMMLSRIRPGGVVLFARNVQSRQKLARLNQDLQHTAFANGSPPLIISIDQEGGRVARLQAETGFAEFPSAQEVGASPEPEKFAAEIARAMAAEMKWVGINMDLAPVLDVNNNPGNQVIGSRSFGADPALVSACGAAFIQALQAEGIMAVGKHFPGHGDTAVDSHLALPVVPHDRERLDAIEFVPFRAAIAVGVAGIMVAHVWYPTIESRQGLAGTLSQRVMVDLLRDEMGFEGLCLTDSLEMGALATSGYPVDLAAVAALQAGADLLLTNCGHQLNYRVYSSLLESVRRGDVAKRRLDEAVRRVLTAKHRFGIVDAYPPIGNVLAQ